MRRSPGLSKIRTLILGVNRGVRLKFKAAASADIWGFNLSGRRSLMVSTTCWIRGHNKCNGNLGSQLDNPEIKWFLNVWISRSAMRAGCRPGGTSWFWLPAEWMKFSMPAEHLLYSI